MTCRRLAAFLLFAPKRWAQSLRARALVRQAVSPPGNESSWGVEPFESVFRSLGYLSLLGMVGPTGSTDVLAVLAEIDEIMRSTRDYSEYVRRLLADRNWRDHLVALTAALMSSEPAAYSAMLWSAFDRGSWVAPQLAVALLCADPGFVAEAKRRIVARCPIVDDEQFFRGQTRDVSAKNLASLLRVLADVQSEATWVATEGSAPDVIELLRGDHDSAGAIAASWFAAVKARFRDLGRNIGPVV